MGVKELEKPKKQKQRKKKSGKEGVGAKRVIFFKGSKQMGGWGDD